MNNNRNKITFEKILVNQKLGYNNNNNNKEEEEVDENFEMED